MRDQEFIDKLLSSMAGDLGAGSDEDTEAGEESAPISIESIDANAALSVADIVASAQTEEGGADAVLDEALAAGTYAERFEEFVGKLGLRHFKSSELLYLGGSNGPGGACAGLNALPSENRWKLIVPTILLLDDIRHELGSAIRITSGYRNNAYNTCVDGKPASFHKEFNALDFQPTSAPLSKLWNIVTDVTKPHVHFKSLYSTFIHLDTRRRL